jgi:DNA polymerase IV
VSAPCTVAEPASVSRVILHVDMDAFYVSVELLRRPELAGRPVVVGGTGPRGVVAAASYEARAFGVRSATPSEVARRLCPQAVFLSGDHAHYADVSAEVHRILHGITPVVEPLALDEAFLDVTGARRLYGDGRRIALEVRRRVAAGTGLRCSVGVAPSKFLAKLASVAAKPVADRNGVRPGAGVVEVRPGEELAFLLPLPVEALWGVGPATLTRLHDLGVRTVAQLAELEPSALIDAFGRAHGTHLARLARAEDDRPVEVGRPLKSVGHEETFPHDLHTHGELHVELVRLADCVAARLRAAGTAARTLTLKVRFSGFRTITRSTTVAAVAGAPEIVAALEPLLVQIDPSVGVRLLGVSAANLGERAEQLSLLDEAPGGASPGWRRAEETVDEIRRRFGGDAIAVAGTLGPDGMRVVRRGAQQWGPDEAR